MAYIVLNEFKQYFSSRFQIIFIFSKASVVILNIFFSQFIADSMTRVDSKYVCKYVSMRRLDRFICISNRSNI